MTLTRYRNRALRRVRGALVGATPTPTPSAWPASGDPTRLSATAQLRRTDIRTNVASRMWAGVPDNATIATTTTAASPTALASAITTAYGVNPNAYHEIQLTNSMAWATPGNTFSAPDLMFGSTGGIRVVPASGFSTVIQAVMGPEMGRIHFRGLTISRCENSGATNGSDTSINFGNYGGAHARRSLCVFELCNIGAYWHPTKSAFADSATWSRGITCAFAISLVVKDCLFWRTHYSQAVFNTQTYYSARNDYRENIQVAHFIHCQTQTGDGTAYKDLSAPYNYNDTYYLIEHETHRGPPDAVGIIGTPHIDFIQYALVQNNILGTGALSKSLPGNMKMWSENCLLATDISGSATEMGVTGVVPSINLYIDSDTRSSDQYPRPNQVMGFFNFILTGTGFVAEGGACDEYIECITATSSPQVPPGWNAGSLRVASGNIRQVYGGAFVSMKKLLIRNVDYSTTTAPSGSTYVNDAPGASAGTRPQDFFEGTFAVDPNNLMWIFSLANTQTISQQAFATAMMAQFKPKSGVTAGAAFL